MAGPTDAASASVCVAAKIGVVAPLFTAFKIVLAVGAV
jgi:hypothetical protein